MRYHQAQDTFVADLEDGTSQTVTKGQPFPEDHPLVQRDLAACKRDSSRVPLFAPLGQGDDDGKEDEPRPSRRGRRSGG